jgi:cardiolipin synthase (CMP-forming)
MALARFWWLPNFITLVRLLLTPAAVMMIIDRDWASAFAIFVVAGLSDALDGWLAKTFSLQSELGAALDPLADKALIVSIYLALGVLGRAPAWLVVLIISRDILILGGVVVAWFFARPIEIRPHLTSKATTAVQLTLAGLLLAREAFSFRFEAAEEALIGLVAALTIASTTVYLWLWVRHMRP